MAASRYAVLLSAGVAARMAITSAGGLFLDGLYRDNLRVTTQLRAASRCGSRCSPIVFAALT